MSGTVPGISMTQQLDKYGLPLRGGKLYFIQAGTTQTPQNVFQDPGLSSPWPNPIVLDAAGRCPQLFAADGQIKIRLTSAAGVDQLVVDNLLVVGPSSGGGGGGVIDPTTILQTGALQVYYGTGVRTGYVRANGRSLGSSTSGATERANADTQQLFEYLWSTDPNLAVSTGRGASANADWVANKTIALPDWRGYALAGLDDMGNSASGRLTPSYFGANATVLGAVGGTEARALAAVHITPHSHSGTTYGMNAGNPHSHNAYIPGYGPRGVSLDNFPAPVNPFGNTPVQVDATDINHGHPFDTNAGNGLAGAAFAAIGPRKLATIYLKM